MAHKKFHLPVKICTICSTLFHWRKKWGKKSEEAKYCREGGY